MIKATDAQNSIKGSIAKVKVSGENKDKIKSVTDKAFDDFVKFVKNGVKPTYEKVNNILIIFPIYFSFFISLCACNRYIFSCL